MPSDKKRINLTVPDALYERLQAFKAKNTFVKTHLLRLSQNYEQPFEKSFLVHIRSS